MNKFINKEKLEDILKQYKVNKRSLNKYEVNLIKRQLYDNILLILMDIKNRFIEENNLVEVEKSYIEFFNIKDSYNLCLKLTSFIKNDINDNYKETTLKIENVLSKHLQLINSLNRDALIEERNKIVNELISKLKDILFNYLSNYDLFINIEQNIIESKNYVKDIMIKIVKFNEKELFKIYNTYILKINTLEERPQIIRFIELIRRIKRELNEIMLNLNKDFKLNNSKEEMLNTIVNNVKVLDDSVENIYKNIMKVINFITITDKFNRQGFYESLQLKNHEENIYNKQSIELFKEIELNKKRILLNYFQEILDDYNMVSNRFIKNLLKEEKKYQLLNFQILEVLKNSIKKLENLKTFIANDNVSKAVKELSKKAKFLEDKILKFQLDNKEKEINFKYKIKVLENELKTIVSQFDKVKNIEEIEKDLLRLQEKYELMEEYLIKKSFDYRNNFLKNILLSNILNLQFNLKKYGSENNYKKVIKSICNDIDDVIKNNEIEIINPIVGQDFNNNEHNPINKSQLLDLDNKKIIEVKKVGYKKDSLVIIKASVLIG